VIGLHSVAFIPDPDVQAWGPVLNTNAYMTNDIVGWTNQIGGPPWHWENTGRAVNNAVAGAGANLVRDPAYPIVRPAGATLYRVRATVIVPAAGWVVVQLNYGRTPSAASYASNPGTDSFSVNRWVFANTAGTLNLELTHDPVSVPAAYGYVAPTVAFGVGIRVEVDKVELQSQGSELIDLSCLVDEVSIHHGRDDTDSQPDASSCTLDLSVDTDRDLFPSAIEVGGIIRVTTQTAGISSTRFVGRVTDLVQGWDEAGADTPNRVVAQIIATSFLAELGRRVVGDQPWVQQLDGARIAAIFAAAGLTLDPNTSDPGTVQILARDVDSQPALEVAQGTAESAGGLVWATRDGDVRYADADHRRGGTQALLLDACDVLVTPSWRRTTEGLINQVSIGYGIPAEEGGDQPRYTAQRDDSIDRYGTYGFSATTELAQLADAAAMGQLLLVRNRTPVWIMAALPVDVAGLDPARTNALLSLEMNDLLGLTGLPAAGNVPTSALLWVEGWDEHLAWGVHEIELVVSGYCRTAPAPRWNDVGEEAIWDNQGSLTWDDATCLGPIPSQGRWDDVPASLRWNQVPAATTWDTWKG
jgi:hypothetical protein